MKHQFENSVYAALVISWGIFKLLEKTYTLPSLVTSYFEDVIALPIILKTSVLILYFGSNKKLRYRFSFLELCIIWLLFSLYYEWYLPGVDMRFTRDWVDFVAYFTGNLLFMMLFKSHFKPLGFRLDKSL